MIPKKQILSKAHLDAFKQSDACAGILQFVDDLNDAVVGVRLGDVHANARTQPLIDVLDHIHETARAIPPTDTQSRFGNPAFRTFYDAVGGMDTVPDEYMEEVGTYLKESWGNRERIDYGSGMELNFLCWLLCHVKLGLVQREDYAFLVLGVFWRYIEVMRYLQSTYWLEPAGSHGVWGLDDYQFLPFLWGAGQLSNHLHLRPKSIHNEEVLEEFSKDYMYLSCIAFINSIKTASLRWHSPMLDDISAVKTWKKVNEGMRKMYAAEVLGKLPVMQHALFGTLVAFEVDLPAQEVSAHGHVHDGWSMDCCGIPVPSAFAEAQSRPGIKPIPFD